MKRRKVGRARTRKRREIKPRPRATTARDRALRESEERYRALFDSASDAIGIHDMGGRFLEVNKALCELLGYSREELLQMTPGDINSEDNAPHVADRVAQLREKDHAFFETAFVTREGKVVPIELSSRIIDYKGKPAVLGIARDITERKHVEEALKESVERERLLADLVRYASLPVSIGYPDGRIGNCNPAFSELTGYTEEELKTIDWNLNLTPPEWRELTSTRLGEVRRTKKAVRYEKEYIRKDGSRIPIELVVHPRFDSQGNIEYYFTFITDITQRNRLEDALRESEERNRMMFENMGDAVAVYEAVDDGRDFVFREFNHAAETIEKVRREDVIGRSVLETFPGVKDFGLLEVFERVWRTGRPEHHPAGIYKDERIVGWRENYVYKLPSGEIVAIYRDITEHKRMEETVRKSQSRLKILIETGGNAMGLWDVEGRLLMFNRQAAENLGGKPEDFVGKTMREMFPTKADIYLSRIKHTFVACSPTEYEDEVELPTGKRWFLSTYKPITDETGKDYAVQIVSTDITELRRMKDELQHYSEHLEELVAERTSRLDESQSRFRELADLLPQIVYEADLNGNFTFLNRAGLESTGYADDDLQKGLNALQLIVPEDHDEARENMQRVLAGGRSLDKEHKIRRKDGTTFPVITYSAPIIREGKPVGLRGMVIDITERKRVEDALRESETQLRLMADSIPAIISYVDAQEHYRLNNKAYEEWFKRPLNEITGRHISEVIGEQTYRKIRPYVQSVLSGHEISFEDELPYESGGTRYVSATYVPHVGKGGEVKGFFSLVIDITKQKRMEARLAESERLATIGEMTAMVGHDLRNPLQAIAGTLYLLRRWHETIPEDLRKRAAESDVVGMFGMIEESVRYMDKIVSDLRDYAGPLNLEITSVSVDQLLNETLSTIRIPSDVKVLTAIPDDSPKLMVDSDMMKRTFTNLILNAIQAMPDGGQLKIAVSKRERDLLISFQDTGAGIPRENQPKLFSPLFTTKAKGQGLGLAVCRRLVEAHGGNITFDSTAGMGSTFTVTLSLSENQGR